ncbi:hypothetical protein QQS21_010277 [Conoideocrella luteorostrata]|uniref:Homeobox domain-containing protein n=1 Tax=Conoideocrella luteorostrata TaxID=1105319 RepID=A0AAJ0CFI1_9HYPO|nr:hypothetical protein QQS21_010277 [Conoideocrella luteorostrata]
MSPSLGDEPSQDADMEKHPKGRRKRTAAKDKIILEEAYRANPKPDKQARQDIVDRVSLNEKEVQIWFQNRRQNDRRKSRPLSPEELAALRFGGMHHVSSDSASRSSFVSLDTPDKPFLSSDTAASRTAEQAPVSPPYAQTRPVLTRSCSDAAIVSPRHHDISPSQSQSQELLSSQRSEGISEAISHSFSNSVGYLANRWNLGSSFSTPPALGDDSLRLEPFPPSSCSSDKTQNVQNSSQSHVRLSLSLEGKAELVSNQASSSRSPPLRMSPALSSDSQPRARGGLSRSRSALPSITLPPISTLTNSLPPHLPRGRSRDVQAWESCADSEKRDGLIAQAEHESNGSAIAAISLLRSSSSILQPSSTKRNASLSRSQQPRQAKKAKLARTNSTFARLESITIDPEPGKRADRDGKVKVSMLVSHTDSDKENWSPDEDGNPQEGHGRRALPIGPAAKPQNPRRLGRVLRDSNASPMLGNRSNTAPSRTLGTSKANSTIDIFEDSSPKKRSSREADVEKFMRGEVSPSKKPDMDCVAGLLSLSQGAWR